MIGVIYTNFDVPVPTGAHVYENGSRVFIVERPYPVYSRRSIGKYCGDGMMHPNDLYYKLYPKEWLKYYPNHASMLHQDVLGAGMFALTLGIGEITGLYSALLNVYHPSVVNSIMDFAMYNNISCSNVAYTFSDDMENKLLFSISINDKDGSYFTELFDSKMHESWNLVFKRQWVLACIENGVTDVYVSIDGTNMDYAGNNNELAQVGHSKSGGEHKIISCISVVCATGPRRGLPLTYFVVEGNKVDSVSVKSVFSFLSEFNLNLKGVLADRGFCTEDIFNYLHNAGIGYVIMLNENTVGYKTAMSRNADEIRDNLAYGFHGTTKFGIATKAKALNKLKFESTIVLVYDMDNGNRRKSKFLLGVYDAIDKWNKDIEMGKYPDLPSEYDDVVNIDHKTRVASLNTEVAQKKFDSRGYYALAVSDGIGAQEADELYDLRDASEKMFCGFKSGLGYDVCRGHSKDGVQNRLFVGFVAAIIRSELLTSCKEHKIPINKLIKQAAKIGYTCIGPRYSYDTVIPDKLAPIFKDFGINDAVMKSILSIADIKYASEQGDAFEQVPRRVELGKHKQYAVPQLTSNSSCNDNISESEHADNQTEGTDTDDEMNIESNHTNPNETSDPLNQLSGQNQAQTDDRKSENSISTAQNLVKRGRGRIKGSKNKTTEERDRLINEGIIQLPPKRPPGRPRKEKIYKVKDDWDLIRKKAKELGIELPPKRERGRPTKIVMEIIKMLENSL